ncbi:MAG TPA: DPP IV N-terminal domain-containing protein [Candidatus Paceibacterota bacterium]
MRPIYSPDGTKIYFISTRDGAPQIYVMNADGGDQRPLTSGPHTNNGHDVSFDGTRVAFQSNRSGNWEIYTMTADGSDVRQLTDNPAADMVPRFAPNGKIVFQSGRDMLSYQHPAHQIYMMNYDGSALIALTQAGIPNSGCRIQEIGNVTPAPTRDGSRIVFLSTASWKRCGQDIFVMDANGKNPRQITYLGIFQGVRGPELSHVPFAITVK